MTNLRMSPEDYARRLWDWTPFNECFERGIRFTDIDGAIECNHHFLFIEGKPPNIPLQTGQRLFYSRLSQIKSITVVILRGYPPCDVMGWDIVGGNHVDGDIDDFKSFLKEWFEEANR